MAASASLDHAALELFSASRYSLYLSRGNKHLLEKPIQVQWEQDYGLENCGCFKIKTRDNQKSCSWENAWINLQGLFAVITDISPDNLPRFFSENVAAD